MQLILYPDRILMLQCKEVNSCSQKGRASLAAAMWKIMDDYKGVGLAAPQVGLGIRMFVWRHYGKNGAIWNPIVCSVSGINTAKEGCLSLPDVSVVVERSSTSQIMGTGINNEPLSLWGNDYHTRIWQHEIDHLDGKLIIDSMNKSDTFNNRNALKTLLGKHDWK